MIHQGIFHKRQCDLSHTLRSRLITATIAALTAVLTLETVHAGAYDDYENRLESLLLKENDHLNKIFSHGGPLSATILFRVKERGQIASLEIVSSSGDQGYDSLVVDSVRALAPFPSPPAWVYLRQLFQPFDFTFSFDPAAKSVEGNASLVAEIQGLLAELGYGVGPVDGIYGENTRAAIRAFQHDLGFGVDGMPTGRLLDNLRIAARDLHSEVEPGPQPGWNGNSAAVESGLNSAKVRTAGTTEISAGEAIPAAWYSEKESEIYDAISEYLLSYSYPKNGGNLEEYEEIIMLIHSSNGRFGFYDWVEVRGPSLIITPVTSLSEADRLMGVERAVSFQVMVSNYRIARFQNGEETWGEWETGGVFLRGSAKDLNDEWEIEVQESTGLCVNDHIGGCFPRIRLENAAEHRWAKGELLELQPEQ